MAYTLQLLHASDLEGGVDALTNAPNFAAIVDTLEDEYSNSVLISAGDNYIPGPFFSTAADFSMGGTLTDAYTRYYTELMGESLDGVTLDLGRGGGRIDISIMNFLGFDASAIGNHEFDPGTSAFAEVIGGELDDGAVGWVGATFPYLTSNIDFSGDSNLADLFTSDVLNADAFDESLADLAAGDFTPAIAPASIIDENGEMIGVVGATTQLIETISSTGGTNEITGGTNDMTALAAVIQPQIDAMIAEGVNKIIVVSHLQQIALEKELAGLLSGVDIMIAGGSDTLQADDTDTLREGDEAAETYPFETTNADGDPVVIVSTDGEYSYIGRLVVEFDDNGVLDPASIDSAISGAYATDEAGVIAVTGESSAADAIDASLKADLVEDLTSAVETIVEEKDAITYGNHDVYLDGRRATVRTEESNMGNLSADANLAAARAADSTVTTSFKNGGGIRAEIGGSENYGLTEGDGALSQLDIENSLRFNNNLALVTLTAEGFLMLLEHGVADTDTASGNTPGRFPQIGGFRFSFDETGDAQVLATDDNGAYIVDDATGLPQVETEGSRVQTVALIDPETGEETIIVENGDLTPLAPETIRMVALDFLVNTNGDGYPFQELAAQSGVDIQFVTADGGVTTDSEADLLGEQTALADFFTANFPDEDNAFAQGETDVYNDARIVQLDRNGGIDKILLDEMPSTLDISLVTQLDSGSGEGGSEVVSVEDGVAYVTNGAEDRIDAFSTTTGAKTMEFDLTAVANYGGVQSVTVKNGLVAAAIANSDEAENGFVAIFGTDGTLLNTVEVGNLPDMVTFTPDGTKILVANEGEPLDDGTDPMGSVSIIDVSGGAASATATTLDFTAADGTEDDLRASGVFIEPGKAASVDLEPEYIAVAPDGSYAWVSLQEANAYAEIDLATNTITELDGLGVIDRSQVAIDASNRDNAINLRTYDNLYGLRQPDAGAAISIAGSLYVLSANEGDARDATEARVADLDLDPTAFPDAEILQRDENLGRLHVRSDFGDTDGDGDYDELYHYGSRSFTIYDAATGEIVYDSGSLFSQLIAEIRPELFNQDEGDFDDRSDDKGVEPEAIAAGQVGDRYFAFIGLERDNGVFVFDITDPTAPVFDSYIEGEANGNLAPETIHFISAEESGTGEAQIAVAYEVNGATAIYGLGDIEPGTQYLSTGAETVAVSDANDTFTGTRGAFDGDTFTNLSASNSFVFIRTGASDVAFDLAAGTAKIGGSSFAFDTAGLSGHEALAVSRATDSKTEVRFIVEDQSLGEKVRVDTADINGIADQDFLSGTGQSDIVMTVDAKSGAKFDNIIGVYEIGEDGTISDVQIAFGSTKTPDATFTLDNDEIAEGTELGFFMIQNGANALGDVAGDVFDFIDSSDDSAGSAFDAGNLALRRNGETVTENVFHSYRDDLNPDGETHVLSGAVDSETLQLGFEDLIGGDNDFQDVVLTIEHAYV